MTSRRAGEIPSQNRAHIRAGCLRWGHPHRRDLGFETFRDACQTRPPCRTDEKMRDFPAYGVLSGMMDSDPNLSRALKNWRHDPPPAPRFNAEVWARIEAARTAPWSAAAIIARGLGIPAQHFRWALPLGASIVLTMAAMLGVGVGVLQTARARTDRMAAAYVQTIDPLQMTAAHRR